MQMIISLSSPFYALAANQGDKMSYKIGDTLSDQPSSTNPELVDKMSKMFELSDEKALEDVDKLIKDSKQELDDLKKENGKDKKKKKEDQEPDADPEASDTDADGDSDATGDDEDDPIEGEEDEDAEDDEEDEEI
tara:strand:- start:7123 stop:7527 length:405 start_codon:yes stop_codon:yes gene_type:complete